MKKPILSFFVLFLILSPAIALRTSDPLEEAELLYEQREVIDNCEKAVSIYEKVLEADPANYEAAWKAARACKWLGDKYPSKEEKLKILEKGDGFAKQAIQIDPKGVDGHYWHGICMGRIGEERGVLNSLFLVGPIKDAMEKVLMLDPEHDGAHHVLGVLFRKAPGWPLSSGDMDKALKHALLSVEYNPAVILNHIGLAEVYMEKGKNKEARESLLTAISLPLEADRTPEGKDEKVRAGELLKEVNKRLGI